MSADIIKLSSLNDTRINGIRNLMSRGVEVSNDIGFMQIAEKISDIEGDFSTGVLKSEKAASVHQNPNVSLSYATIKKALGNSFKEGNRIQRVSPDNVYSEGLNKISFRDMLESYGAGYEIEGDRFEIYGADLFGWFYSYPYIFVRTKGKYTLTVENIEVYNVGAPRISLCYRDKFGNVTDSAVLRLDTVEDHTSASLTSSVNVPVNAIRLNYSSWSDDGYISLGNVRIYEGEKDYGYIPRFERYLWLGDAIEGGFEGYENEVDYEGKKQIRRTEFIELDGYSDGRKVVGVELTNGVYCAEIELDPIPSSSENALSNTLCTHFEYAQGVREDGKCYISGGSLFLCKSGDEFSTVEKWNSWLEYKESVEGDIVGIEYVLSEYIEYERSDLDPLTIEVSPSGTVSFLSSMADDGGYIGDSLGTKGAVDYYVAPDNYITIPFEVKKETLSGQTTQKQYRGWYKLTWAEWINSERIPTIIRDNKPVPVFEIDEKGYVRDYEAYRLSLGNQYIKSTDSFVYGAVYNLTDPEFVILSNLQIVDNREEGYGSRDYMFAPETITTFDKFIASDYNSDKYFMVVDGYVYYDFEPVLDHYGARVKATRKIPAIGGQYYYTSTIPELEGFVEINEMFVSPSASIESDVLITFAAYSGYPTYTSLNISAASHSTRGDISVGQEDDSNLVIYDASGSYWADDKYRYWYFGLEPQGVSEDIFRWIRANKVGEILKAQMLVVFNGENSETYYIPAGMVFNDFIGSPYDNSSNFSVSDSEEAIDCVLYDGELLVDANGDYVSVYSVASGELYVGGNFVLDGVWKFNSWLKEYAFDERMDENISFTSNDESFDVMSVEYGYLHYSDTRVCTFDSYVGTKWIATAYRTVDFGDEPQLVSAKFYFWFTGNAIKQEE